MNMSTRVYSFFAKSYLDKIIAFWQNEEGITQTGIKCKPDCDFAEWSSVTLRSNKSSHISISMNSITDIVIIEKMTEGNI